MIQTPHDKFCILPWVSLEIGPVGTVRTCCLAEEEILDNSGQKFDLSSSSFLNIQDSNYMRDLRQQFIDGKQPSACRKCWNEERAGRTSKRMLAISNAVYVDLGVPVPTLLKSLILFLQKKKKRKIIIIK